jgi:hypothetical protein
MRTVWLLSMCAFARVAHAESSPPQVVEEEKPCICALCPACHDNPAYSLVLEEQRQLAQECEDRLLAAPSPNVTSILAQLKFDKEAFLLECQAAASSPPTTPAQQSSPLANTQRLRQRRLEYMVAEQERLVLENRALRQSLRRTQELLLETQGPLTPTRDARQWDFISHWMWEGMSDIWLPTAAFIRKSPWGAYGRDHWQTLHGSPWWRKLDARYRQLGHHATLMAGLAQDLAHGLVVELVSLIRDLPALVPQLLFLGWQNIRGLDWWGRTCNRFQGSATVAYARWVPGDSLSLGSRLASVRQRFLPSTERLSRAFDDIEKDMAWMREVVKDLRSELFGLIYPFWEDTFGAWGNVVVEGVGFVSRTIFLFLRVYKAPQFLLNVFEYGSTQPASVLAATGKLVLGVCALRLMQRFLQRFFAAKKSKRPEQQNVHFAETQ